MGTPSYPSPVTTGEGGAQRRVRASGHGAQRRVRASSVLGEGLLDLHDWGLGPVSVPGGGR